MANPLSASAWPHLVSLTEARRGAASRPVDRHLVADAGERVRIAEALGLEALESLEAHLRLSAWRDGARIEGAWRARIVQICGISLEPFASDLAGDFALTVVPAGSLLAEPPAEAEIVIDPEAEDPPDVLAADQIDLGGYVVEHLALDVDPFPRKPGVAFEAPPEAPAPSPFAALAGLKNGRGQGRG